MYKIIGHDRQVYGPVSAEQLRQWINEGRVVASTRAQRDETSDWQPLSNFPEFTDAFQGAITSSEAKPLPPLEPVPVDPDAMVHEILERDYAVNIGSCLRRGWQLVRKNFGLLSGAWLVVWLIDYVTKILGGPLEGGLNWLNLKRLRGQPARFGDVFDGFTLAFLPLFLGAIVMGVFVVLGLCLFILPGIYLLVSWKFALTLIIDKKLKFWPAMRASRQVVDRHWWRIFGLSLVLFLVAFSGLLLLGIGIFLTIPIARAAFMFAYEDIFNVPVPGNGSGSDKEVSQPALPPRKKMSLAGKGVLIVGGLLVILMILHGLKSWKSVSEPKEKSSAPVTVVKPTPPQAKTVEVLASPDKVVKAISLEQLYEDNVRYDGSVVVAGTVSSVQTVALKAGSNTRLVHIRIGSADDKYLMSFGCDDGESRFELFSSLKKGQLVAVEGRPHMRPAGLPAAMEARNVFTNGFIVAAWDPSRAPAPAAGTNQMSNADASVKPAGIIKIILPVLPDGVTSKVWASWVFPNMKSREDVPFIGDTLEIPAGNYMRMGLNASLFRDGKVINRFRGFSELDFRIHKGDVIEARMGQETRLALEFERRGNELIVYSGSKDRFAIAFLEENHGGEMDYVVPDITLALVGDETKVVAKAKMTKGGDGKHLYSWNIPRDMPPGSRIKAFVKWNRGPLFSEVVGEDIYTLK